MSNVVYALDCEETIASAVLEPLPAYSKDLYRDGVRYARVPWNEGADWRPSPEVVQALYYIATGRVDDPYDPDQVLREFLSLCPGSEEVVP